MKSSIVHFVVFAVILATSTAVHGEFIWRECEEGAGSSITINTLDISPMPLVCPGNVSVSYDLTVDRLGNGTRVEVDLKKITAFWGRKYKRSIPCIGNIGSCDYELCEVIEYFGKIKCEPTPNDVCRCPPAPADYQGNRTFEVKDELRPVAMIVNGNYEATFRVKHADNTLAGCMKAEISLDIETFFDWIG